MTPVPFVWLLLAELDAVDNICGFLSQTTQNFDRTCGNGHSGELFSATGSAQNPALTDPMSVLAVAFNGLAAHGTIKEIRKQTDELKERNFEVNFVRSPLSRFADACGSRWNVILFYPAFKGPVVSALRPSHPKGMPNDLRT